MHVDTPTLEHPIFPFDDVTQNLFLCHCLCLCLQPQICWIYCIDAFSSSLVDTEHNLKPQNRRHGRTNEITYCTMHTAHSLARSKVLNTHVALYRYKSDDGYIPTPWRTVRSPHSMLSIFTECIKGKKRRTLFRMWWEMYGPPNCGGSTKEEWTQGGQGILNGFFFSIRPLAVKVIGILLIFKNIFLKKGSNVRTCLFSLYICSASLSFYYYRILFSRCLSPRV